jgi:hypothetical protein
MAASSPVTGRAYLDPGDRLAGRYDPPRRCVVLTQWVTGRGKTGPRNVAVRYLDDGTAAVIPFPRRLRKAAS